MQLIKLPEVFMKYLKLKSYLIQIVLFSFVFTQNYVLHLDGDGDYVSLPNIIINHNEFTIEAWAKMDGVGGGNFNSSTIFQQRDDMTDDYHSAVLLFADRPAFNVSSFYIRTNTSVANICESDVQQFGSWHHYAGVTTLDMVYYYIDGILVDSVENNETGSYAYSIDYIDIGRHRYNQINQGFFWGDLDEIRIWSTPRTENEIQNNMFSSIDENTIGLLAYWDFNNQTTDDISGNGHNGVPMGDAEFLATNYFDCALTGDVNSDQSVDIYDVLTTVDFVLGRDVYIHYPCTDCNDDGQINILDVVCILNVILR